MHWIRAMLGSPSVRLQARRRTYPSRELPPSTRQVHRPDIRFAAAQPQHHLIEGNCDRASGVGIVPIRVKMMDRDWRSDRLLVGRTQALAIQAPKIIAPAKVVDHVTLRSPLKRQVIVF